MVINRRQLRIKVLQMLYAFEQSGGGSMSKFEKELDKSVEKTYDLYLYYLLLLVELRNQAIQRLEDAKNKYIQTEEDLNPRLNFINNKVLMSLAENTEFLHLCKARGISWDAESELVRSLFIRIRQTELYNDYLSQPQAGAEGDINFLVKLYKKHIANDRILLDYFEEKSIYWLDDIDLVASMVIKHLKKSKEFGGNMQLPSLFNNEEDERNFYRKLFHNALIHKEEYDKIIRDHTQNWDIERIARMDILLMRLAVTEVITFEDIPVKVTLNEYIELAKQYSTSKSNFFINGILDKVFDDLKKQGKIRKSGRGLIE